jgi:hypothetical protein
VLPPYPTRKNLDRDHPASHHSGGGAFAGQAAGWPFWNIVSCNQIRKQTTIPSPANLALQAYTTLAAGGRGVSWYKYYHDGYDYAPIDAAGDRTNTWRYLQTVNRQLRVWGPLMNRLTSRGVFFSAPAPVEGLPPLPGQHVAEVRATVSPRGLSEAVPSIMVGEFQDEQGGDYVMLVNLSLTHSANVQFSTVGNDVSRQIVSAEDGRLVAWNEQLGHWLPAGCGVLIRLQGTVTAD